MPKISNLHQDHVNRLWNRRVTADPHKAPKMRLTQAGRTFRGQQIQGREGMYHFVSSISSVVYQYAQSEKEFSKLIAHPYFKKSSRKKPQFSNSYGHIVCFALRANSRETREKAQRIGLILQMFDAKGIGETEVYSVIRGYGGTSAAHKAAKDFFDRSYRPVGTKKQLAVAGDLLGIRDDHSSSERESEATEHVEGSAFEGGRGTRPPTSSVAPSSRQRRRSKDLQITADKQAAAAILGHEGEVSLTMIVKKDPKADDGWKLLRLLTYQLLN